LSRKIALAVILHLMLAILFFGCGSPQGELDPQNPVTITMWHNYGGQMKDTMDALIDQFNDTVGREHGIIINVTSIQATKDQNEKLAMIAAGDPGTPEMPDIVTVYPAVASSLADANLLAPLDNMFTEEELSAYIPSFIDDGRLSDGKLYVFPISKSTEALFINKTLFDRFAKETGASLDSLFTFEGIAELAQEYYAWTDAKTPDISNDGKTFFTADSWFNVAQVGVSQLGGSFVENAQLNTDTEEFKKVWDFSFLPAISGAYAISDGYSSDLAKTGEIVCSTGSTAGILFYGDTVTYADNTKESVEYIVLPYLVFEGGRKVALQRGAGMAVAKPTAGKELAATIFLKWFTSPEQNMRFVSSTGYLPVTKEAFEEKMTEEMETVDNPAVKKLLETATLMYEEYTFIVSPNFSGFTDLTNTYEKQIREAMREGRQQVESGIDMNSVSGEMYKLFIR
jgi:multiple sugar transport system substrate-binding protein